MKKTLDKYIHVRPDADLAIAIGYLIEDRGALSRLVNDSIRHWYEENRDQLRLRSKIRRIARNMSGAAYTVDGIEIPHSVFVEWDKTWTVAEDLKINCMSWENEIETAIREQESSHYEYYYDEIKDYVNRLKD